MRPHSDSRLQGNAIPIRFRPILMRPRPIPDASVSEAGIGASQTIRFNVGTDDPDPNVVQDTPEKRRWKQIEDVLLISAWLKTDKVVEVVGNETKAASFWKRIAAYVSASPKVAGFEKRGANHCKQKWHRINDIVYKFVGCYEQANSQISSDQVDDDDVIKLAYQLFYNNYKVQFTLEHAWRELRNNQKWCAFNTIKGDGSSKKRKLDDGCAQSSSSNTVSHLEDQAMAPPPSVKASKGNGEKIIGHTREEEGEGSSPLEKDLAMKEKLAKMGLLNSLITKREPLSDIELALKNKLITYMLNNI